MVKDVLSASFIHELIHTMRFTRFTLFCQPNTYSATSALTLVQTTRPGQRIIGFELLIDFWQKRLIFASQYVESVQSIGLYGRVTQYLITLPCMFFLILPKFMKLKENSNLFEGWCGIVLLPLPHGCRKVAWSTSPMRFQHNAQDSEAKKDATQQARSTVPVRTPGGEQGLADGGEVGAIDVHADDRSQLLKKHEQKLHERGKHSSTVIVEGH